MSTLGHEILGALRRFQNVIAEGAPGTGKTYVVHELNALWQQETGRPLLGTGLGPFAIVMHPSTSYEDFVEGLRYDESTQSFKRKDGFVVRAVTEAEKHPEADYLLLLDEINRCNVPKVLGDLLLTLEPSKRRTWDASAGTWTGGVDVTLPYSGSTFSLPSNVYVLGTMNTSDRSVAPLDAALRRRFAFVRVSPFDAASLRQRVTEVRGSAVAALVDESITQLTELNAKVLRPAMGPDGELGHSYFFDIKSRLIADAELCDALKNIPGDVTSVFWTEIRSGNGGSKNQLDLAESGAHGRGGSLELFYPLTISGGGKQNKPDPARKREDHFTLTYEGKRFENNRIWYNDKTPVWRLFLEGHAADGTRLSSIANQVVGADGHSDAKTFEYRILIWFVRDDGSLLLKRLPASPSRVAELSKISKWTDQSQSGASGRSFGPIDLPALRAAQDAEPRLTWRYAILPQLVEFATANGVEDLFDPTTRTAWQATHGDPADASTLEAFDDFLAAMTIYLRVVGLDLGRHLTILDEAPIEDSPKAPVAASAADAAAAGNPGAAPPDTPAAPSPPASSNT